jgi:hypothetical protein
MSDEPTKPVIEDLVDFYKNWPELRSVAVDLRKHCDLCEKDIEVLNWMIRVVDRVGPADLERDD